MEHQNEKPSIEEVKEALRTISKYCDKTDTKDCDENCAIYQLLGDCPIGTFVSAPEDWKID